MAKSFPHAAMHALAECFFAPLEFSGPVSLEAKLDAEGQPWIIEPTLGRTDYWLDCCVANGVNLPLIEHQAQSGLPVDQPTQTQDLIWFDTERSPGSYLRLRFGRGETATDRFCLLGRKARSLEFVYRFKPLSHPPVWRWLVGSG